ncbi:conserved hypothetical protein [Coccidioides posadasii str. Silveira]|uniref:Uncharacterized protein n=1 Tax=Coccidioides posadasii (strain RMSCC 757 / Silveira) TaxID=443226 RepID=E9CW10_COCPS|nr:conserved hypothetical protein [Coccidioides posadasii str. Silveira]
MLFVRVGSIRKNKDAEYRGRRSLREPPELQNPRGEKVCIGTCMIRAEDDTD